MAGKHAGRAWLGVCLASLLTACSQGDGFADLDKFMADTRAKPRGHVEPLPEFKAYEAFSYSAADRRAPFEPPIDVQLTMVDEEPVTDVEPDLDRPREVLENFEFKSVSEEYHGPRYHYRIGFIRLDKLIAIKEKLRSLDIFLAATGKALNY